MAEGSQTICGANGVMGETGEVVFQLEAEIGGIAKACGLPEAKVGPAAALLAEGNTIPFIARYRKERTGGLDETALRAIEDTIGAFRELAERKNTILKAIGEQDKLTDALRETILACRDKKELEELYLPYKLKRRTRATIARQRGLEPLAEILKRQVNPGGGRQEVLRPYIRPDLDVPDGEAALQRRLRHRGRAMGRRPAGPRPGARSDVPRDALLPGAKGVGRQAQQVRVVLRPSRTVGQGSLAPLPGSPAGRGRGGLARAGLRSTTKRSSAV